MNIEQEKARLRAEGRPYGWNFTDEAFDDLVSYHGLEAVVRDFEESLRRAKATESPAPS